MPDEAKNADNKDVAAETILQPFDYEPPVPRSQGSGERPGTRIGPYRLVQLLGEGGMGSVWMAEQTEPIKRTVALKVIKAGMDSHQVLARFEVERQALAVMDHPSIARVLDAGTTDSGRPYFVMELVKGIPITKYCDQQKLNPRERLELFSHVCHAIQHAHQKGIIHRDIKPSNVLVATYDGKPLPKVIDFGLAKATGVRISEHTLVTQFGSVVGTFQYMSPEQAHFNALDVDTRTDIYSLGVVLYELLTGTTPITQQQMKTAALHEMLRVIRDEEPPRPSTRLSQSGETLASVAAQRKVEPAQLSGLIRGELDWIVMKSLDKDRNRRYETANAFALDVQRYLHDEPVSASPPSATYRLRKFAKRNKGPFAAAAVVLIALIVGIIGTTWGLLQANAQRDLAEKARLEEARQRDVAVEQRNRAVNAETIALANQQKARDEEAKARASEERAKQEESNAKLSAEKAREEEANARASAEIAKKKEAEARISAEEVRSVLQFFEDKVLSAARPFGFEGGLGIDASIRAAINAAEPKIADAFKDQPLVEAQLRNTLGLTYWYLGETNLAIAQHERALELRKSKLGSDHLDTLVSMNNLALVYKDAYRLKDAIPLLEQTSKGYKAKLGIENPTTLLMMSNLAWVYQYAGRLDDALPLVEEVLKVRKSVLGPEHLDTLISMGNLAGAYREAGRLNDALLLYEQTVKLIKTKLGNEHPHTLTFMNDLADTYRAADRLDEALELLEETFKVRKAKLGSSHPDTMTSMNNLAGAYQVAGRLKEALPLFEETLKMRKAKLGPDHPDIFTSMNNLASAYQTVGRLNEAVPLFEETLKLRRSKLGPTHPSTLSSMTNLAFAYQAADRFSDAFPLYEETLKLRQAKLGIDHPDTLLSMHSLAGAYRGAGRLNDAINLCEEILRLRKAKFGPDHPDTLTSMNNLAVVYRSAGRVKEALPLFEDALKLRKAKLGAHHPITLLTMNNLALGYQFAGRLNDAEALFRDSLALWEKNNPNDIDTFATNSLLGDCLLAQKKYAEAEPLLLKGYQGMLEHKAFNAMTDGARFTKTLERLIQLYEETNRPDEAAKWRKQLDAVKQKNKQGKKIKVS